MKEIGSEFWSIDFSKNNNNNLDFLNIGKDYKLLMSGRTAIDYVLQDIIDTKKIAYMPDYCCESMVKPFIDNGYKIEYYKCNIIKNSYEIDENIDCSVFFAMSYFGYNSSNMDNYIEVLNKKGTIIIEDITHRLLSNINHSNDSTYLIASLRKWFPIISGGIAIKMNDMFKKTIDDYTLDIDFINEKKRAMDLKKDYINGKINAKDEFLKLFNSSNERIEDYRYKKIDDYSIEVLNNLNVNNIIETRIKNSLLIEEKLKLNSKVQLLYKLAPGDCPLFVPIIIDDRDNKRKKLINNQIYLPVHWPNELNIDNKIYEKELSLVCDQRYNEEDIKEYIDTLIKIIGDEK